MESIDKGAERIFLAVLGLAFLAVLGYVVLGLLVRSIFGPTDPPTNILEPTMVGVIDELTADGNREQVRIGDTLVTLDEQSDLDFGSVSEGDLLLLGAYGDIRWYTALAPGREGEPAGCYRIGTLAWDEADAILFDGFRGPGDTRLGIRLQKADRTSNYGRPFPGGAYSRGTTFCVNEEGAVFGSVEGLLAPP